MVRRLLGHVPGQLRHLHVAHKILLQTRVDDFALRGFQAVRHVRDATLDVLGAEIRHVTMDEFSDRKCSNRAVWNAGRWCCHVIREPTLAVICSRLGER